MRRFANPKGRGKMLVDVTIAITPEELGIHNSGMLLIQE